MTKESNTLLGRRSVLAGIGVAAVGAATSAETTSAQQGGFQAARHNIDTWMAEIPGSHRAFIDSATAYGGAEALHYARNILNAHKNDYNGEDSDYAMIVCLRHYSTVFGFGDAIWKKYGKELYEDTKFADPITGGAPDINLMQVTDRPMMPNGGATVATIDYLRGRGVQFAICDSATHWYARYIAAAGHGEADDIYKELIESAIPDSRMVSAGVMAVTRAQEYGYSLLFSG